MAWTMVTELVAGLSIGFAMGLGLDWLFNARPWFLVIFTLLGFAAGVQTMLRTATTYQQRRREAPGAQTNTAAEAAQSDGPTGPQD